MAKLTTINRATCKILRKKLNDALTDLSEEYGLTIHAGNASYDDARVTFKVSLTIAGHDQGKADFEQYAGLYGLKAEDHGREFSANGEAFRLVGVNLRSPKYCFAGERISDGKRFKFTETIVKQFADRATA